LSRWLARILSLPGMGQPSWLGPLLRENPICALLQLPFPAWMLLPHFLCWLLLSLRSLLPSLPPRPFRLSKARLPHLSHDPSRLLPALLKMIFHHHPHMCHSLPHQAEGSPLTGTEPTCSALTAVSPGLRTLSGA
jgi:hypothetical protein